MREALISDVHADIARLSIAFRLLKQNGYDRMRCLGDVAGDNRSQERETHECVDFISRECDSWLLGNHDELAGIASRFKTPCIKDFIDNAHYILKESESLYAHAQPSYSNKAYVLTPEEAKPIFQRCPERIIFVGHTHIPAAISSAGNLITFEKGGSIILDKRLQWILNPGAIGRSRDDNPAISCALYDSDKAEFTVLRG